MRSRRAPKRILPPDLIYSSRLISRFINKVMRDGKKALAQKLVYKALEQIRVTSKQDPMLVFEKAIQNVSPKMEVKPRRMGGASYMVPIEVRGGRREALAIRWIIDAANGRPNKDYHTFDLKLAQELMDASAGTGGAIKKRDDVQKQAAANRAFSHFRW